MSKLEREISTKAFQEDISLESAARLVIHEWNMKLKANPQLDAYEFVLGDEAKAKETR